MQELVLTSVFDFFLGHSDALPTYSMIDSMNTINSMAVTMYDPTEIVDEIVDEIAD